MNVEKRPLKPTGQKDNGQWTLDTQHVVPEDLFTPKWQALISIEPKQIAGNHYHPWQEVLLGFGRGALFLWQDEHGTIHKEPMDPDSDQLHYFVIPPNVPHAVVNTSDTERIHLYEYYSVEPDRDKVGRTDLTSHSF